MPITTQVIPNVIPDLLPTIDVQRWLQNNSFLPTYLTLTGTPGPATDHAILAALSSSAHRLNLSESPAYWTPDRRRAAIEQLIILDLTSYDDILPIDGIVGPKTQYGLELYHNISRDLTPPLPDTPLQPLPSTPAFPRPPLNLRQSNVRSILGEPGNPDCSAFLTDLPFPLRMDGSFSKTASIPLGAPGAPAPITRISCHKLLHASLRSILQNLLDHYGLSAIQQLGINQYAGAYNYRKMRGSTQTLSMHAWGAAIDLDAQRNTLHETATTARFARREYQPMIDIFYEHGWIGLGRERNMDWMHLQAPALG